MPDLYRNFAELAEGCTEFEDYMVHTIDKQSPVLSMAIHGGGIERGSGEIARKVAAAGAYNFYEFEGIRRKGNMQLHITAARFDEPKLEGMLPEAQRVLSFHGVKGKDERFVMLGGLDDELRDCIGDRLSDEGFDLRLPKDGLHGVHPRNVVNRGASSKGVQLEISKGLRSAVLSDDGYADRFTWTIQRAVDEVMNPRA